VLAYEDFVEAAVGGIITTASVELARFAAEFAPPGSWQDRSCVELGSGCGLVSGALVRLGARVVATEQAGAFLEHLRWNVGLNTLAETPPGNARCEALDWGDDSSCRRLRELVGSEEGADGIFAANCVYDCALVEPFFGAVAAISGPQTQFFMCGIPKPPVRVEAATEICVLDAFLQAILGRFDCYLILTGQSTSPAKATAVVRGDIDTAASAGVARTLAQRHSLSVNELADAIWLLVPPGVAPPTWLRLNE